MSVIENFEVSPLLQKSNFVRPFRITFQKNGVNRYWDGVKSHDGVSILIFNKDRRSFVFVKQFRPVVYYTCLRKLEGEDATSVSAEPHTPIGADGKPISLPSSAGETLELCAGIVDKAGVSLEEIAADEVFEECGYRVEPSRLTKITSMASSVGLSGTSGTLFYVEVTDSDLVPSAGGGNEEEGESIEVVYWPIERSSELLSMTETKIPVSAQLLLGVLWFQQNVKNL
uniref:Uridine diphosphate glucose pyrophosphatase NUDT14 n=1 Tax=Mesocestoides corti TaxID=53468 RepID=A0A5K3FD97_MESCO